MGSIPIVLNKSNRTKRSYTSSTLLYRYGMIYYKDGNITEIIEAIEKHAEVEIFYEY